MSEYIIEVEYDTFNGTFTQKRHEEIVRCRDCRMFDGTWCEMGEFAVPHMEGGYCAWGIRKE